MDSSKDKFRNPPLPLGYVRNQPEIVLQESNNLDGFNIDRLIQLVIDSVKEILGGERFGSEEDLGNAVTTWLNGLAAEDYNFGILKLMNRYNKFLNGICEEPDPSIYDKFTINSSSDEEDILVGVQKEVSACNPPTNSNVSEDLEQTFEQSTSSEKISVKTKPGNEDSKQISLDEQPKKPDEGSRRSQKVKEREDAFSDNDSSSYSKTNRKHKKKKVRDSSDDSHHRSRNQKRGSVDSDSGSHSRSQQKKSHDSDSDSYSRSRHRRDYASSKGKGHKRFDPDSDSSCYRRKFKKSCKSDSCNCPSEEADRKPTTSSDYFRERFHSEEGTITNIKGPASLHGEYSCHVCRITVHSFTTYQSHINGKRHTKNLDAQNDAESSSKESIPVEAINRFPKPPSGYYRKNIDCIAKIQSVIDKTLEIPCPGLDSVTEIHGITEISYYCFLCDAQCSTNSIISHLEGFRHQLNLLKKYERDLYQKWSSKPKCLIEQKVIDVLRDVEKAKGRGLVTVEKDYRENAGPTVELEMASLGDTNRPSTSGLAPDKDFSYTYMCHNVPDPSKSGYYCKQCDSHSNSQAMWMNHIYGKRHIANAKKAPGTAPSKRKYIPAATNVRPFLLDILEKENVDNEPIVGLNQIREIRKPDIGGISYNCFLCGAFMSNLEIVNHLVSKKHREKYLESIKHPDLEILNNCQMTEASRESVIKDICTNVVAEIGTDVPEVYYAKNAVLRG